MHRLLIRYFTISLPAIICVALFGVAVFQFVLPRMEEAVLTQKHAMVRELVHIATDLMRTYDRQVKAGVLTEAEARTKAVRRLSTMRYGSDRKDYFWITDKTPRMIMHPYRTDLVGQDLSDYKDANGKRLFVEMVEKAKSSQGGYVEYLWQWKDNPARIEPKRSYVAAFEPWGWVVGTGVYLDDLQEEMASMRSRLLFTGLLVLVIVASMAGFLTLRTISSEKKSEQALVAVQESEEKFRGISSSTNDGIVMIDSSGKVSYWNEAAAKIFGLSREEIIGQDFHQCLAPGKDAEIYQKGMAKFHVSGSGPVIGKVLELDAMLKDGKEVPIELSVSAMRLKNEWHAVGVVRDISARKKMESEREQATALLVAAIEQSPAGIIIADAKDHKVIQANAAAQAILGVSDTALERDGYIGDSFQWRMLTPEGATVEYKDFPIIRAIYKGDIASNERYIVERPDGERSWIDVNAAPVRDENGETVYGVLVFTDVTRRIKNEEDHQALRRQVQRSQKLEALGTLAGGIAHDFNNILFSILGYAELAELNLGNPDKLKDFMMRIHEGGMRARDLVQQILAFSRQTEGNKHTIDAAMIIKEATKLLRASIPTTVEIKTIVNTANNDVFADPTHIHQIIMNLCTNSAHAMEGDIGTLTVTLDNVVIGEETAGADDVLPPGEFLDLKVRDTGQGISDDVLDNIFDPFFTTKAQSQGTGMGLAVVHGLVKEMGGSVLVDTEVGVGTTFRVLIPKGDMDATKPVDKPMGSLPKGTGCILLVDDEESIVVVSKEMLERLGYDVTNFTDSRQALDSFARHPTHYDLVITDLSMPKMTGIALAREIKSIRSDIPILLWTGFSDRLMSKDTAAYGIDEILMKPPGIQILAETVARRIGGHKS